jgi:LAS superfamily LD-carboxypeptidase LdcB
VRRAGGDESGQALLLVLGLLLFVLALALAAGAVARGLGDRSDEQRAVDLAALAAARVMADRYAEVVDPIGDGHGGAGHDHGAASLDRAGFLRAAERAASTTAARNGLTDVEVDHPDAAPGALPLRVRVRAARGGAAAGEHRDVEAVAEAAPPAATVMPAGAAGAGQYTGPLEHRDGKPMRPDVAQAYDRMRAAARAEGVTLVVTSGFRTDAEQAVLFAQRPDPKWVAPPGKSLHRLGTELDLGPAAAHGWLGRNAKRFGFIQRYSWEPWHFGFVRNAGTASVGYGKPDGAAGTGMPDWVPGAYRPMIARAAQRWNVGAVLLAAQLQVESGFNPRARSHAGAMGIAQFMPGTAKAYGLRDPFDPAAAIDAQARLMRDLLRSFAAVPLALAAYNAGPGAVQACRCAAPYAETRDYVARILAIVLGTGDITGLGAAQLTVRLVS